MIDLNDMLSRVTIISYIKEIQVTNKKSRVKDLVKILLCLYVSVCMYVFFLLYSLHMVRFSA